MLLVIACAFAACSDDDNNNTNGETTVSFANATLNTKESAGLINIPIKVEGARNGDVSVVVKAEEVGESPAVEDKNYIITSKSLRVKADTLKSATMNVETKIVDDDELNQDRVFKLTIVSANGAKIGENASILVTIRDNEKAYYEQFFGTWTVTGYSFPEKAGQEAPAFTATVEITGDSDENSPNYDKILTAKSTNFFNVGVDLNFEWHFRYTFDKATKKGTLGFICDETVASFTSGSNKYTWCWLTDDGRNYVADDLATDWSLVNDRLPNEIVFPEDATLYFYCYSNNSPWNGVYNIKMTRKK